MYAAKVHHATDAEMGGVLGEFEALNPVPNVVVGKPATRRIETAQTTVGAEPQPAVAVLENAVDVIVGEAVRLGETSEAR